jgi:2-(3-amino-3-carboxypropyl)histidine synthase
MGAAEEVTPVPGKQEEKKKPRRIIRRRRQPEAPSVDGTFLEKICKESSLPPAYNFEVSKCMDRIYSVKANHVALQMPEGLLMYATVLADIMKRCAPFLTQVSILGDVTYGACCVDDLGAKALGADLLLHYGHSCLVPIKHTVIPCLYVFVELQIDVQHMVDCVRATLPEPLPLALLGTIQFRQGLVQAKQVLEDLGYKSKMPQVKPLSPGEVLGCTSPKNIEEDVVVFCADGRFHLESCMIANPQVKLFLRYDPYSKTLTEETYDYDMMKNLRQESIQKALGGTKFGIILGTLGRQGNPAILKRVRELLAKNGKKSFVMLLSEISPQKLSLLPNVDVWVQIACPRLSVDWGHHFSVPVLSPYELHVALNESEFLSTYPMDFYSSEGGPWSNYHTETKQRSCACGSDDGCDKGELSFVCFIV